MYTHSAYMYTYKHCKYMSAALKKNTDCLINEIKCLLLNKI